MLFVCVLRLTPTRWKTQEGQSELLSQQPANTDEEDKVDQVKYVLECESAEEKIAWENAVREQMWKAGTKDVSAPLTLPLSSPTENEAST